MRFGTIRLMTATLFLGAALATVVANPALAQSTGDDCVQKGYKPGTAAFYRCLQDSAASGESSGSESQGPDTGEAGSILGGSPDSAVTDYSGSTMSGATTPDPNILKQLINPKPAPK